MLARHPQELNKEACAIHRLERGTMLVISRNKQQSVQIGPDITVMVIRVHADGRVQLGIEAPKDVKISRAESPRLETKEVSNHE